MREGPDGRGGMDEKPHGGVSGFICRFDRRARRSRRWVQEGDPTTGPPENLQVNFWFEVANLQTLNMSANEVKKPERLAFPCVSPVGCRPPPLPDQPLALRQLLWLDDDLFVGVVSGPLPTSSTLLMLRPDGDAGDALTAR